MKRIIYPLVLMMIFLSTPVAAEITEQELYDAKVILHQMANKVGVLEKAIKHVLKGEVEDIFLTAGQIQTQKNIYINEKAELQTLYQELP